MGEFVGHHFAELHALGAAREPGEVGREEDIDRQRGPKRAKRASARNETMVYVLRPEAA